MRASSRINCICSIQGLLFKSLRLFPAYARGAARASPIDADTNQTPQQSSTVLRQITGEPLAFVYSGGSGNLSSQRLANVVYGLSRGANYCYIASTPLTNLLVGYLLTQ